MRVKVTTKSFSRTPELVTALRAAFPDCDFRQAEKGELDPAGVVDFLADADAAIVGLDPVSDWVLERLPRLRAVCKYGVGLDNVDVPAARRRGVYVGWTPGVNRRSVAELVLGMMLGLTRNMTRTSRLLAEGQWLKQGGVQLSGSTVGIIGLGHIGKDVAALLAPFGCRVLVNDIVDQQDYCRDHGLEQVALETIWRDADVMTVHTPLTPLTHHLVNGQTLAAMKPGAILINTARGPIVEQAALKAALISGHLGGAALDVYDPEPPQDLDFLALPNLICTPHIGGNAHQAVLAMGYSAIDHLKAFASGAPQPPLPGM